MQESWAVFSVLRPGGCFSTDKFYATVQVLSFEIQSGCQRISHEHQINIVFCVSLCVFTNTIFFLRSFKFAYHCSQSKDVFVHKSQYANEMHFTRP